MDWRSLIQFRWFSKKGERGRKKSVSKKLYKNSFNLFISRASEDKEITARPLAEKLREFGFIVWYAEFQISAGNNLELTIENTCDDTIGLFVDSTG